MKKIADNRFYGTPGYPGQSDGMIPFCPDRSSPNTLIGKHPQETFSSARILFCVLLSLFLAACATMNPQKRLANSYHDWKGTPYQLGGTTKNGVDCSAFVQIVMRDQFGIKLPRTTAEQMDAGRRIRRSRAGTGDLVFFQTGSRTLHVGIMVDNDRFIHASVSQGVTISSLSTPYWRERYIRARRLN